MFSAQSHKQQKGRKSFKSKEDKIRTNRKFYNSKAWKDFRISYINKLTDKQYNDILNSNIKENRKSYLLSMVPVCEICYRLYKADAYDKVNKGCPLDHIDPVNPEDAIRSKGWGEPLDENNVQLLCDYHHNKKSGRENKRTEMKLKRMKEGGG